MTRVPRFLSLCVVGAVMIAAVPAAAAPKAKGADGKRFRLHVDTNVLDFAHFDADGGNADEDDDDDEVNQIGFGFGRPVLIDGGSGALLLPRPLLGLGFGYIFLENRAIVGGRVALSVDGSGLGGVLGGRRWCRASCFRTSTGCSCPAAGSARMPRDGSASAAAR